MQFYTRCCAGYIMSSAPNANDPLEDKRKRISSYVLVAEYGVLFIAAVAILLTVCLRSTSRLRTRLVYFYVITIIISLGMWLITHLSASKPRKTRLLGSLLLLIVVRLFAS